MQFSLQAIKRNNFKDSNLLELIFFMKKYIVRVIQYF